MSCRLGAPQAAYPNVASSMFPGIDRGGQAGPNLDVWSPRRIRRRLRFFWSLLKSGSASLGFIEDSGDLRRQAQSLLLSDLHRFQWHQFQQYREPKKASMGLRKNFPSKISGRLMNCSFLSKGIRLQKKRPHADRGGINPLKNRRSAFLKDLNRRPDGD